MRLGPNDDCDNYACRQRQKAFQESGKKTLMPWEVSRLIDRRFPAALLRGCVVYHGFDSCIVTRCKPAQPPEVDESEVVVTHDDNDWGISCDGDGVRLNMHAAPNHA